MSEMLIINICFFCNENNKKEWSGFFSLRCLPHEKPCPRDQRHKDKLSVPPPPPQELMIRGKPTHPQLATQSSFGLESIE